MTTGILVALGLGVGAVLGILIAAGIAIVVGALAFIRLFGHKN